MYTDIYFTFIHIFLKVDSSFDKANKSRMIDPLLNSILKSVKIISSSVLNGYCKCIQTVKVTIQRQSMHKCELYITI
jgi:hypothetical protein